MVITVERGRSLSESGGLERRLRGDETRLRGVSRRVVSASAEALRVALDEVEDAPAAWADADADLAFDA